jgi:hypothetical protein
MPIDVQSLSLEDGHDDDDVVHLLRAAIEREGQIAFAKRYGYGVNRAYFNI